MTTEKKDWVRIGDDAILIFDWVNTHNHIDNCYAESEIDNPSRYYTESYLPVVGYPQHLINRELPKGILGLTTPLSK